jgi:hypothetical protein
MTVGEFEDAVWNLENVRIVVRASRHEDVDDYDYARQCAATKTVAWWLENRVKPLLGDVGVAVIDGAGERVRRNSKMATVRDSY